MRLKLVKAERIGCLRAVEIPIDGATALIGRNGAGKSTLLRVLKVFYNDEASSLTKEDFFDGCDEDGATITLQWDSLPDAAQEKFGSYIQGDTLTVSYVIEIGANGRPKGTYRGLRLQHRPFVEVRQTGGARDITNAFGDLIEDPLYAGLDKQRSVADNTSQMIAWETEHPEHCELVPSETQFFGIAGGGYLNDFSTFIYVPAVRDASSDGDAGGDKSSGLRELMDRLVRASIMQDEQAREDLEQIKTLSQKIYGDTSHPRLDALAKTLTGRLSTLAPGSALQLRWSEPPQASLRPPSADVRLTEDGYAAPLDRVGHGLQRAYILSVLQELSELKEEGVETQPAVVLGVEEPELYQHPNRQRHLADVLRALSSDPDKQFQVIYTTHSPLFVSVAEFGSVRRLTKKTDTSPAYSFAHASTLDDVAVRLGNFEGRELTGDRLFTRLRDVVKPWVSEGFFADGVTLVEGGSDRAALLGLAQVRGEGFARHGVSILPVGGKNNLLACALVFQSLGIDTYMVWDCDYQGPEPEETASPQAARWRSKVQYNETANKRLFDLHVEGHEALFVDTVSAQFACFKTDLETALREDWSKGAEPNQYTAYRDSAAAELGITAYKNVEKNPGVMKRMIELAAEDDREATRVLSIYSAIRSRFGI